jgi:hypothetical protein
MPGRAARSSCSCSTTSRGLGVSDLRPSKLTEPEPERDFGGWGGSWRQVGRGRERLGDDEGLCERGRGWVDQIRDKGNDAAHELPR